MNFRNIQISLALLTFIYLTDNSFGQTIYQSYKKKFEVTWDLQFQNPDSAQKLLDKYLVELNSDAEKLSADSLCALYAELYNNKGTAYYLSDNYPQAIEEYRRSYEFKKVLKDTADIAMSLNNIAVAYHYMGQQDQALDYHYRALSLREAIGDLSGKAMSMNNIGLIYKSQKMYNEALDLYERAYKFVDTLNNKFIGSAIVNNLGGIYAELGEYDKAIPYFLESCQLDSANNDMNGLVTSLGNYAKIHHELGDDKTASFYYAKAIKLAEELGIQKSLIFAYKNYAEFLFNNQKYNEAWHYAKKAYDFSVEIKDVFSTKTLTHNLSEIALKKNDMGAAYHYLKIHMEIKDSLVNIDKKEEILKKTMQFEYHQKELKDSIEFAKKDEVRKIQLNAQKELIKKDKKQLNYLYMGLSILALMLLIIIRRFWIERKQKKLIADQKITLEAAHEQLEERNREVMDSINYAQLIQQALLKSEEHESEHLPKHFVYFKPKDIVSGDFYWSLEKEGYLYLAVADCTGHGVPGAFLTMLGTSFLNEINAKDQILEPAEILNQLRNRFITELSQKGDVNDNKDGMDISLLRLHIDSLSIQWSGANNGLYIIDDQEKFIELKPDKQPIGYSEFQQPFTNHSVQLKKDYNIYLYSDGFPDQFGGEKGKKYKYKSFKDKLIEIHKEEMQQQKILLKREFMDWKGSLEQIDDVCVIGVRV
ncbi:MAG: tetratricopeptide repeat protein [Crocinitomicaceae bacterium]